MSKYGKVHEDFCNSPSVDLENQVSFLCYQILKVDCMSFSLQRFEYLALYT